MAREIKFRARIKDGYDVDQKKPGEWFYFTLEDIWFSDYTDFIDWDTLGEYTALKDKNGKEIYEGDIVDYIIDHKLKNGGVRSWRQIGKGYPKIVAWKNLKLAWNLKNSSHYRVIGNIYENPNLIK